MIYRIEELLPTSFYVCPFQIVVVYSVPYILDEIEDQPENFAEFTKMEAAQEHQMMQDFIDRKVKERNLAEDLVNALSKPKAATGFKFLIDGSKYKEEWVDYRRGKYHDWVKEQVDSFNYAED